MSDANFDADLDREAREDNFEKLCGKNGELVELRRKQLLMSMTKDERTVYVFALRYALPRHTYALSIVSREILSRLNDFEDWELDGMIRDCWIYYPSLDCGGDMDRRKADEFKNKLLAELVRRGRDDLLSRLKDEAERRGL